MALTIRKLSVADLCIGMYVSKLDRPWLETPFLMQGFMIQSHDEIHQLEALCQYVYIDERLGKEALNNSSSSINNTMPAQVGARPKEINIVDRKKYSRDDLQALFPGTALKVYEVKTGLKEELADAENAFNKLSDSICDLMIDIRNGNAVRISTVKNAISPMVSSVIRNPGACMWLARMKSEDAYIYKHSLSASIWSVSLGRQIGLPPEDLKTLAIGTLLCDVGMLKLPNKLHGNARDLNEDEMRIVRSHVDLSVMELSRMEGVSRQDIDIVAGHHERYDGEGYPNGLFGNGIPIMARIAAIADSYDAMISQRPYAKPKSPADVIKELYKLRDKSFQSELVEEFIQAIGVFPAGTLVELSSGEVAIVIAENKLRRLRPKIIKLLDKDKNRIKNSAIVNLAVVAEGGEPLHIVQSLEPGAYGVNSDEIYF